jgi:DNA-directed RNA polymerase specialized sigma subunit
MDEHTERAAELKKATRELREQRDAAIRLARDEGVPLKTIAGRVGLSHQRISQIVER